MASHKFTVTIPSLRLLSLMSLVNQNSHAITQKGMPLVLTNETSESDFRIYKNYSEKIFINELALSFHMFDLDDAFLRLNALKTMKDDICKDVIKYDGYVFGGHVRDFIYGDYVTTRNIDIISINNSMAINLVNFLMEKYNIIDNLIFTNMITYSIQHKIYNDLIIIINITWSSDMDELNGKMITDCADFDIDMLYFDLHDNISVIGYNDYIHEKHLIYKNILYKRFFLITKNFNVQENQIIKHSPKKIIRPSGAIYYVNADQCVIDYHDVMTIRKRIIKMQSRGWKMLNDPCPNPKCVLCPAHIKLKTQTKNKLLNEKYELKKLSEQLQDQQYILALKDNFIRNDESDYVVNIIHFKRNEKSKSITKRKTNKVNIKWRHKRLLNKGFVHDKKIE